MTRQKNVHTQISQAPQTANVGLEVAIGGILEENVTSTEDKIPREENARPVTVQDKGMVTCAVARCLECLHRQIADRDHLSVPHFFFNLSRLENILLRIYPSPSGHVEADPPLIRLPQAPGRDRVRVDSKAWEASAEGGGSTRMVRMTVCQQEVTDALHLESIRRNVFKDLLRSHPHSRVDQRSFLSSVNEIHVAVVVGSQAQPESPASYDVNALGELQLGIYSHHRVWMNSRNGLPK